MGRNKAIYALMTAAVLTAFGAWAETLQVHMVQATNKGAAKVDGSLKQFENLLKSNLPFKRFSLVDQKSAALPAKSSMPMKDYVLGCQGTADNMKITLSHKGREVMNSNVKIQAGKPLVVGGFPDADDPDAKILLILTVTE